MSKLDLWHRNVGRRTRTIAHLRPSQILWRLRYSLERRLPIVQARPGTSVDPRRTAATAEADRFPDVPVLHRLGPVGLVGPELVDALANGRFHHLNWCEHIGRHRPDWRLGRQSENRLWTMTLHYHAWVHGLAEAIRSGGGTGQRAETLLLDYLTDWMTRCDLAVPGARDLVWNSFAIATRLSWWTRSYLLLGQRWMDAHPQFQSRFLSSLWRQAEYLEGHLEWDLRANHLLRDLVGLAWAGRFFRGPAPQRWMARATRLVGDQLDEQVLADGGHFERSPMYHIHVMEDLLSLALLLQDGQTRRRIGRTWSKMADFLTWMRHPDGDIPLFNDGACNAVSHPTALLSLADRIGPDVDRRGPEGWRHFADSGLVAWHGTPWTVFFDVGPVGPDCQPGHAHADTLSIECSYNGRRLFVDPGTYAYDLDERRRYDRSTASHNTVCIDQTDSSEVWHVFRVGARAIPRDVQLEGVRHGLNVTAGHDGYDGLTGSPRHTRRLEIRDSGALRIVDRIAGHGRHSITGGYLLADNWHVRPMASGWAICDGALKTSVHVRGTPGVKLKLKLNQAVSHPEYGLERQTARLQWKWQGTLPLEVITDVEGR